MAAAEVGLHKRVNGLRVARRNVGPLRHRRLVRHEEAVHVPGDEPCRRGLPAYDVDYVLAREPAVVAEEGLLAVVVVFRPVLKEPRQPSVWPYRVPAGAHLAVFGVPHRPAREGAGTLLHVLFRIAADPHGEQLQELPAVILVYRTAAVVLIVQPDNHRWVPGQLQQQRVQAARSVPPEHPELVVHHPAHGQLVVCRGEDAVPEERDLLLQRRRGGDHAVQPVRRRPASQMGRHLGVVAADEVLVHSAGVAEVQQLVHNRLVAFRNAAVELFPGRAEARPAHQMGHELELVACHALPR